MMRTYALVLMALMAVNSLRAQSTIVRTEDGRAMFAIEKRSDDQYVVRRMDRASGKVREVTIPHQPGQPPMALHVAARDLVVLHEPDGGNQVLHVMTSDTLEQIDTIWCYFPTFSPSGRVMAYIQQHPRFMPQGHYAFETVMAYDLDASPEANRKVPAPHNDPRSVGWPVFKPVETARPYDFSTDNPEDAGYLTLRPAVWHGSGFLIFTYYMPSRGNELVVVDLRKGVQRARDYALPISPGTSGEVHDTPTGPVIPKSLRVENGAVVLVMAKDYDAIDGVRITIDVNTLLPDLRGF